MRDSHPTNWLTREDISMYQKILVPIDGSETATQGLNEAIRLAKNQGGELRLLHIVNEYIVDWTVGAGIDAGGLAQMLRDTGRKLMQQAQTLARQHGIEPDCMILESFGGPTAALIVEQAKKWPADLIVMGTHGRRGLRRFAMGSDAESVVRDTPVPVLLIHSKPDEGISPSRAHVLPETSKQVVYA
jgi:nucleotide-binding universal stress UspA family protein